MGRAIVTGGDKGLYDGAVQFDTRNASTAIEAIDREISQIDEDIEPVEEEIAEIEEDIEDKAAEWSDLATAYNEAVSRAIGNGGGEQITHPPEEPPSIKEQLDFIKNRLSSDVKFSYDVKIDVTGNRAYEQILQRLKAAPEPYDENVKKAFDDCVAHAADYHALLNRKISVEKYRDMLLYRQEALRKRKAQLQEAIASTDTREMWCADYTENLTGEVDTLEVMGAPTQILVQPGGVSNLQDDAGTAGKLANIMTMTPAGAGFAWALLPGWQKWRPTYRIGTIHDIDYENDTASVTMDAATSIAQGLNINQTEELTDIDIEYMECNADAFEDGDKVVVEFPGQVWGETTPFTEAKGDPKVIGFEDHPKRCPGYSVIIANTAGVLGYGDINIFEWEPGIDSDGSGILYSEVPADEAEWNNVWKSGATVKIGCSWKFPFEFVPDKKFSMIIDFDIVITYPGGGRTIIPCELRYNYAPKDKTTGNVGTTEFSCYYLPSTFSAPYYVYGGGCHPQIVSGELGPAYELTWDSYPYSCFNLNSAPSYNFGWGKKTYTWVHPLYADGGLYFGIWYPGANVHASDVDYITANCEPCDPITCLNPGIKCDNIDDIPLDDYLDVADPCDEVDDKNNLYIEQEWSMEGIIEADGVTLNDGLSDLTFGGWTSPFGPYAPKNAVTGSYKLTSIGPIAGPHHVGWRVRSAVLLDDTMAPITEQDYLGGGTWGPKSIYTGDTGYIRFYGIIVK